MSEEARADRCPTCGSESPDTCRYGAHNHSTDPAYDFGPAVPFRCCRDPFHKPAQPESEGVEPNMEGESRVELWWCPTHGQVAEAELIEGRNPRLAHAGDPDGWTDTYYCPVIEQASAGAWGEGQDCYEECTIRTFVPTSDLAKAEAEVGRLREALEAADELARAYERVKATQIRDGSIDDYMAAVDAHEAAATAHRIARTALDREQN